MPNATSKKAQQDIVGPKLRKTKLCSFFVEGKCRRGSACGYAHGTCELEVTPDLTKTSICFAWKQGLCPNSASKCPFAHGHRDLRVSGWTDHNALAKASNKVKTDSTTVLPQPPGLITLAAPLESQVPSPKAWPGGLQPMKVRSPKESKKSDEFMPMKVIPSGGLAPWTHWESETIAGESSSDDDGDASRTPTYLSLGVFDQAESSLFFDEFDSTTAMGASPLYNPALLGILPNPSRLSQYIETKGVDPWTTHDLSCLGAMPTVAW